MKKHLVKPQFALIIIVLLLALVVAVGILWRNQQSNNLHNVSPSPLGSNISE